MIQFNNYKYIGQHKDNVDSKLYAFDKNKYNKMLEAKRFQDAAEYLEQFQFNDLERQAKQEEYIAQLKHEGRKVQAYYGKLNDSEIGTVDFVNSVYTPGGLKNLRYQTNDKGEYIYKSDEEFRKKYPEASRFVQLLNDIGSTRTTRADSLKIEFDNTKYGFLGIDPLKRDHDDYEDMLRNTGLTEMQLKSMGCDIRREEGKVFLEFSKNAECATRILTAIPHRNRVKNRAKIIGICNGKEIQPEVNNGPYGPSNYANLYAPSKYADPYDSYHNIAVMQNLIKTANNVKTKTEIKRNLDTKNYSATIFDITTDRLDLLDEMYNSGQIDWTEYNARRKEAKGPDVRAKVNSLTYGDYKVYSNWGSYRQGENSEVRREIEQKDWDSFKQLLTAAPASKVHFLGETSNGLVGLHITIDSDALYSHKNGSQSAQYTSAPIQVFIPGFLTDEIQSQMNNRTELQARQEWNDMLDYGYTYKFNNGTALQVDENGNVFRYDKEGNIYEDTGFDAKERALIDLEEDFMKEAAKRMKYQFMNEKGEYNYAAYNDLAENYAIKCVNSLFPDIPLTYLDGTPITKEDLHSIDFKSKLYQNNEDFNYLVVKKLQKFYELFEYLTIDLMNDYTPKHIK